LTGRTWAGLKGFFAHSVEPGMSRGVQWVILAAISILALVLGWAIPNLPLLYILIGIGGIVCTVLAFFKIEWAILFLLLIHGTLERLDYLTMGGDLLSPNRLLGLLIFAGGVFYLLTNEIDYDRIPGFFPFLAFLGASFVSVAVGFRGDMGLLVEGITAVMRLGTAFVIYTVLLYKLNSRSQVNWVIGIIIFAELYPTAMGLKDVLGGGGETFENMGTARLGGGTSGVGAFLVIPLTLCFLHFLKARTNLRRLLFGALTGFFAIALLYSYGRAGWIGFVLVLFVTGLIRHQIILLTLPAFLVVVLMTVPTISARFADIDPSNLDDAQANTLNDRVELWRTGLDLYQGSPLFGIGFGISRVKVGALVDTGRPQEMHNDYVQALVATGIIGFLTFLWWQVQLFRDAIKTFRWSQEDHDRLLSLALLAILVAFTAIRLTDNVISNARLYPLMAIAAAVIAIPRLRGVEQSTNKHFLTRS